MGEPIESESEDNVLGMFESYEINIPTAREELAQRFEFDGIW